MIGQRLKDLRREKKISQENIADILGIQKATVSNYETGKAEPSDRVKIEMARFFDVSLDYLMGIIDESVPHYRPEIYMKIPETIKPEERELMEEFIACIDYKRKATV